MPTTLQKVTIEKIKSDIKFYEDVAKEHQNDDMQAEEDYEESVRGYGKELPYYSSHRGGIHHKLGQCLTLAINELKEYVELAEKQS